MLRLKIFEDKLQRFVFTLGITLFNLFGWFALRLSFIPNPGRLFLHGRRVIYALRRGDVEIKPLDQKISCFQQRHFFLLRNEVENIAAAFATAETIPATLADADAESRFVLTSVNRASARDAVTVPVHVAHQ